MLREVSDRYGRGAEPHALARKSPEYRTHESLLLDSPFSVLEGPSVVIRKPMTVEEIVARRPQPDQPL